MNYMIPFSAFFPLLRLCYFQILLYDYRDLPFESMVQEAVVLYVRGHCTVVE